MRRFYSLILVFSILLLLLTSSVTVFVQESQPIYVVFIWHYHQPWYYGENDSYFILPWVRMHSVGNYFKMAYILSKYPDVKVTFTFSGSLLAQLESYLDGVRDLRQILSEKVALGERLTPEEVYSIVSIPGGFFDINWGRIVDIVPRYRELRDKTQALLQETKFLSDTERMSIIYRSFAEQDIIDLVALFNLFWIDPQVLRELYPDLYSLRENALKNASIHFTREQIRAILDAHMDIMKRIIPIYRDLLIKRQIELIPVPYSHPLAPLITDFGWKEDLYIHSVKSIEIFKRFFNYTPSGVWPAEQAVNEYVIRVFAKNFTWSVSDQSVLGKSGVNANDPRNLTSLWYIPVDSIRFYMFFRSTELSNLISFTYSSWNTDQAVNDLVNRILELRRVAGSESVVVIALDGENPWENYVEFGDQFLNKLYYRLDELQRSNIIRTITPTEYIERFGGRAREIPLGERVYLDLEGVDISDTPTSYTEDAYQSLPRRIVVARLGEGSWAGGELTIWIGQRQENAAWMLLAKAREDLLRFLGVSNISEAMRINSRAVEYLLRAEASDWFWWYGGDGGGLFPANPLYKSYLRGVYVSAGLKAPDYLLTNFNPDATPVGTLNSEIPKPISRPIKIDGVMSQSEWSGYLNISIGNLYKYALVSVDSSNAYIALIPASKNVLNERDIEISIYTTTPWKSVSPYHLGYNSFSRYSREDLGMGLFYEIRVNPALRRAEIYTADGREEWVYMYPLNSIAVRDVIEISVPWTLLGLREGDITYVTIAIYANDTLVESSTRGGLVYYLQVPRIVITAGARVVIDVEDPVGDDNGPGTYVYPKADVFKPGVFDLVRFRVVDSGDKVLFETYFRELGDNPWNGPNGFCLQYTHIYIRTTRADIPSRNDTFGLNVILADNSSWHIALLLAPGWGSDPAPQGERAAIYYYNGTVVAQDGLFKVYSDPSRNAIIAEVDKSLLFDTDNISRWVFTVAVASYDGYGPNRIRPVGVSADTWVVGAGAQYAQAILFNVAPLIMDLLAPTREDQYRMLNSFVINKTLNIARPAVIHGINYTLLQEISRSYTPTTQTKTYTETIVKTISITTSILRETTIVSKQITTVTEITPASLWMNASSVIGLILVGLVAGFVIGYLARYLVKKRS
ncbi:MAG: glucodextranase DOMON-like domain-containing protein [Sulfolobales archaeon]